jgi:hypothetical protein
VKCGFPSGATDQLVTRTTGVLLRSLDARRIVWVQGAVRPLETAFSTFQEASPQRTILVNVRSTRPPIRRQMKPPRCFDLFDRVNIGMSLRHGLLPVPPPFGINAGRRRSQQMRGCHDGDLAQHGVQRQDVVASTSWFERRPGGSRGDIRAGPSLHLFDADSGDNVVGRLSCRTVCDEGS